MSLISSLRLVSVAIFVSIAAAAIPSQAKELFLNTNEPSLDAPMSASVFFTVSPMASLPILQRVTMPLEVSSIAMDVSIGTTIFLGCRKLMKSCIRVSPSMGSPVSSMAATLVPSLFSAIPMLP